MPIGGVKLHPVKNQVSLERYFFANSCRHGHQQAEEMHGFLL